MFSFSLFVGSIDLTLIMDNSIFQLFIYSILIIPLAILLGRTTNDLSDCLGDKLGGLLTSTCGNLPELIMSIWSIRYGMILMAKGALIGCIMSNMLLGLGIAIAVGGVKYKEQSFNKIIARTNFNMLLLALSALVILSTLDRYAILTVGLKVSISFKAAILLIGIYILGLIFSLSTHKNLFLIKESEGEKKKDNGKIKLKSIILICIISILIYFISEKLIGSAKNLVDEYNLSQEFLGIILIPILGNIGETISTIISALRNKINLSIETAIGSSIQMALFVTPVLMIVSFFLGLNMNLMFPIFEIIMTGVAVAMSYIVFQDGKSYWFEGAILIVSYILITIAFFYLG